jgi:hypothetical protein
MQTDEEKLAEIEKAAIEGAIYGKSAVFFGKDGTVRHVPHNELVKAVEAAPTENNDSYDPHQPISRD